MKQRRRPKGSGTIRITRGGKYRALLTFPGAARPEDIDGGPFDSYEAADRALAGLLVELRESGALRGGITLLRLGERVLDRREKEGYRSVDDDRNRWKSYVESWEPAAAPARLVTRGDIRDWLAGLAAKKLATQTRRNALNLLRAVFAAGVEDGILDENPCIGMKVKDRGRTTEPSTHLTLDEVSKLLAVATDPAVALAIGTGMRSGELRSLRWKDVLEDEIIVRYGKPGEPKKNGKVHRIPILPLARQALEKLPRSHEMVLPTVTGCYRPKGRFIDAADWKRWKAAAGITRPVRPHDLRHTTATLLLTGAWGEPWSLEAVKELLNHSSVKVTERYAKATGTLATKAARAMMMGTADKRTTSAQAAEALAAQATDLLRRRGSDSNRRMTVLQGGHISKGDQYLHPLALLSRSYVEAVANGDPFAHVRGLDLAEVVFKLIDAASGVDSTNNTGGATG